jgi:hypothetical protein
VSHALNTAPDAEASVVDFFGWLLPATLRTAVAFHPISGLLEGKEPSRTRISAPPEGAAWISNFFNIPKPHGSTAGRF